MPSWYLLGEAIRDGHWPILLFPDMWMGGNFASEAQLGLWNPMMLGNAVLISLVPNTVITATILKTEFMVILAIGAYMLIREYGASRGPATAIAIALPFAGYTLYIDASMWVSGLITYAFIPWFWWAVRRFVDGRSHALLVFATGYLLVSTGYPYAVIAMLAVLAAVTIEQALQRRWRKIIRLSIVSTAVLLTGALTYLPLRGTASRVSWRATDISNTSRDLVPHLSDFLNMSSPTYLPDVMGASTLLSSAPVVYLAWFVVPLIPWLAWSSLRSRKRELAGLAAFGGFYLLLTLLPSQMLIFRWPLRFIDCLYLALGMGFALLLSTGLRTDRWRLRLGITATIVLAQAYLSWGLRPERDRSHAVGLFLMLALTALLLAAIRFRQARIPAVLIGGSIAVLGLQIALFPVNFAVYGWRQPHDVAAMRAEAAGRFPGNTLQLAAPQQLDKLPADKVRHYLAMGDARALSGVTSLNSYTGIGFKDFHQALCIDWAGQTCPKLHEKIWEKNKTTGLPLIDMLRVETLVIANYRLSQGKGVSAPPAGWSVRERGEYATILHRDEPLPWPDGRLAWAAKGVTVLDDRKREALDDPGEELRYRGSGRIMLATLAWPGWHAVVDGKEIEVRRGPAGLVDLQLPESAANGSTLSLHFRPPQYRLGVALAGLGLTLIFSYAVVDAVLRRRHRGSPSS